MSSNLSQHSHSFSQNISDNDHRVILLQLSKSEEEARFYRTRYFELKSINQSIITAIKRVYSQEVGEELEKIVEQEEKGFSASRGEVNQNDLTDTFCQKMKTWGSKLISEQSIDQLPLRSVTPKKNESEMGGSMIKNALKINLTPLLSKTSIRKLYNMQSPLKGDYQASTRRTSTPLRSQIATEIYCQLCERVFPPNQFVNHAERCKYQLQYIETQESTRTPGASHMKTLSINYDKMMKNLLKIREEIEQQIYMISATREDLDRTNLRRKLEKDLKAVMKVITEKEEERKGKKVPSGRSSKTGGARKGSKLR